MEWRRFFVVGGRPTRCGSLCLQGRTVARNLRRLPGGRETATLTFPPSGFELAIALGPDFLLAAFEHGLGRDVAQGAVQPDGVVMLDVTRDQAAGILERKRATRTKAFGFEGLMPAFDLAVRLRIEGR